MAYLSQLYTSHVPAVGAALDLGKRLSLMAAGLRGYDFSKKWLKEQKPDVIFRSTTITPMRSASI